jgi:hypothetical protein
MPILSTKGASYRSVSIFGQFSCSIGEKMVRKLASSVYTLSHKISYFGLVRRNGGESSMPGKKKHHEKHHEEKKGKEEKGGKPETEVREENPDSGLEETDGSETNAVTEEEKERPGHKKAEESGGETATNSQVKKEDQKEHSKPKTKHGPHKK